jgi:hypothetical protein
MGIVATSAAGGDLDIFDRSEPKLDRGEHDGAEVAAPLPTMRTFA